MDTWASSLGVSTLDENHEYLIAYDYNSDLWLFDVTERKFVKKYIHTRLGIVKRYLAGESPEKLHKETGINDGCIRKWKRQYLAEGEESLENKKKPGNPLSKYERRKELSGEEQLEYPIELLKRELLRRDAEVLRL